MKFGKSLSNQIEETLPEWRDKFLSYKELKKCLKRIRPSPSPSPPHHTNSNDDDADADAYDGPQSSSKRPRLLKPPLPHPLSATAGVTAGVAILSSSSLSPTQQPSSSSSSVAATAATNATSEELDFMRLLEEELDKFNTFFLEKEEEYVIRQKDLQDRMLAAANDSKEDLMKTRKEIVDFHGEMVLLENYSALNYTGLVKILKKYDKRTGALLRLPFIQKVLQQPFFTTDLLYKLVKECETMLDCLFPAKESPGAEANTESTVVQQPPESGSSSIARGAIPDLEEIEYIESLYMKSTVAALRVLKEIRKGSSTVSVFSLPPLQSTNGLEDRWGKIPVLEQEAK